MNYTPLVGFVLLYIFAKRRQRAPSWTPLTPAMRGKCNPQTSMTGAGGACVCSFPDLVINDGGGGDCNRVIACRDHGTFIHKDTRKPFDGTWSPKDGVCACFDAFTGDHCQERDKCFPNGKLVNGRCTCRQGFISWRDTCIADPCGNSGHWNGRACQCDPHFTPVDDPHSPVGQTCRNVCAGNPCGNRGLCHPEGSTFSCEPCTYPFYSSPDGQCRSKSTLLPGEACDNNFQCMTRVCAADGTCANY